MNGTSKIVLQRIMKFYNLITKSHHLRSHSRELCYHHRIFRVFCRWWILLVHRDWDKLHQGHADSSPWKISSQSTHCFLWSQSQRSSWRIPNLPFPGLHSPASAEVNKLQHQIQDLWIQLTDVESEPLDEWYLFKGFKVVTIYYRTWGSGRRRGIGAWGKTMTTRTS